jgi:F-type H+-transporting ATPase subunit gamma
MPESAARSEGTVRGAVVYVGFAAGSLPPINDALVIEWDRAAPLIFLIGTRGTAVGGERGVRPAWIAPMATSAGAIPSLANRIADALYERVASGRITEVDVAFSQARAGSSIQIDRHSLLPIDLARFPWPVRNHPPLTALAPSTLLERLAAEYVYAQLCEAAMHAFAAENEARMMAMAAARTNIEAKLGGLSQREHQLRQEEITTEIVELAAGAEALMPGHRQA